MIEALKELLMKKANEGKFLSDEAKESKSKVVDEMSGVVKDIMAEDVKKVTVAAPDSEGLLAGLEKAGEVVESQEEVEDEGETCGLESLMDEPEEVELSKEERIAKLREELALLENDAPIEV